MRMILILLILTLTLWFVGCTSPAEENKNGRGIPNNDDLGSHYLENGKTNEQIIEYEKQRLREIFEIVEYDLERFVTHLKEYDLLDRATGFRQNINFLNDEERESQPFARYPLWVTEDPKLYDIVNAIESIGVIYYISVVNSREADVFIEFVINKELTHFLRGSGAADFRYIEGHDNPEIRGNRHISGNWYYFIYPAWSVD